jgi:hypothetical protein
MVLPALIVRAAEQGEFAALRQWFAAGVDVNEEFLEGEGLTLLHAVARRADCEAIRFLLRHGARVDQDNRRNWLPIHYAINGYPGCPMAAVKVLLDAGADINAEIGAGTHCGWTVLTYAASEEEYEIVRFLLRRGAIVRECDIETCVGISSPDYRAIADLLVAVRAAGGWKPYVRAPRARLLALRHFCLRGDAAPPAGGVIERLFSRPSEKKVDGKRRTRAATRKASLSRTDLPKEVVYHVLEYWRSARDDSDPRTVEPR